MNQLWIVTKAGSFIGLLLFLLFDRSGGMVDIFQQVESGTKIDSASVCSPGTHQVCKPGPFSESVRVPDNAIQIRVDVYWDWEGHPDSIQTNEHSYFTLTSEGERLGRVYCEDMGDGLVEPQYCGTVEADVEPGQNLRLTIVHADEETGDSPGSHSQDWVISWMTRPAPPTEPAVTNTPVPTQTATPQVEPTEETVVPTETATAEAPTETPVEGTPTGSPTPGGATQTPTPAEPETTTPTASPTTGVEPTQTATGQVLPTETTLTPTVPPTEPAPTGETPTEPPDSETEEPPAQPTRTPAPPQATSEGTPAAPGEGAAQAATAQPTSTPGQLVPQTGADLTVDVSNLYPGLLVKGGVVLLGAALVLLGFQRKNKRQ